jgi:dynein heavy chain 2
MKINFSERLVLLIRETRQLCEMGYKSRIPHEVLELVENGKKFYREALTLKQVAAFYNSMDS